MLPVISKVSGVVAAIVVDYAAEAVPLVVVELAFVDHINIVRSPQPIHHLRFRINQPLNVKIKVFLRFSKNQLFYFNIFYSGILLVFADDVVEVDWA